jgi:DNA repair protein REV1
MSGPGVKGIESSNNEFDRNHFERLVFHVDMDCFFAAVALRNYPQYRKMPVAIAHAGKGIQALPPQMDQLESKSPSRSGLKKSTSECATCNYEARKFGIKKGMFLGRARELCPNLIILNYDFEGYEEVSDEVIGILHHNAESYHGKVEQVSCDEAYVELFLPNEHNSKDSVHNLAYELCEKIRSEIFAATQCTASIGVGQNKFLAKLATDKVKPNGCYVVKEHTSFLENLQLRSLPGIGHRIEQKCLSHQLNSVKDVWDLGDDAVKELSSILGAKTAEKIAQFCSGRDDRPVQMAERKTIGAEVSPCRYT